MPNNHQFLKVYKKVKTNRSLTYLQKLVLSEIISYQLQGRFFFVTNKGLASEYGCSSNTIQKAITALKDLLFNEPFYPPSTNGGRPPKRRKLLVKNLLSFIPEDVLLDINIDIKSFKSIDEFMLWCNHTFSGDYELITEFIIRRPYIERHLGKIL